MKSYVDVQMQAFIGTTPRQNADVFHNVHYVT